MHELQEGLGVWTWTGSVPKFTAMCMCVVGNRHTRVAAEAKMLLLVHKTWN